MFFSDCYTSNNNLFVTDVPNIIKFKNHRALSTLNLYDKTG